MSFLYNYLWDLEVQTFLLIEYNLFALNVSFLIGGYLNSDEIIEKWKKSILDKERLEKETIQAKLRALQANLSPHFLFNNFNALNSLIDYNTDQAQEYLEKLSDVYRYILKEKDN
jgi:sensor histidine kinase YesM